MNVGPNSEQCIKVKGFTLSHNASQAITFDKMKEVAFSREGLSLQIKEDTTIGRDIKRLSHERDIIKI